LENRSAERELNYRPDHRMSGWRSTGTLVLGAGPFRLNSIYPFFNLPVAMSSFRETAIPVKCGSCGTRVLIPHVRPGTRFKCPKCGAGVGIPAGIATAALRSTASIEPELQPPPILPASTKALPPAEEKIAAEIEDLLLAGLADAPPKHDPLSVEEGHGDIAEKLAVKTEPESPPEKSPQTTASPQVPRPTVSQVGQTDSPPARSAEATDNDDAYKLSDSLGQLPIPAAHGAANTDAHSPANRSSVAESRMQHILEVASAGHSSSDASEGEIKPKEKQPKYTPHATLDDPWIAFLRGVFEFPFYLDVIPHWIKLAFTGTIAMALLWWILDALALETPGPHGLGAMFMGALVMIAPATFIGAMWIAMMWAVGTAIIEDTAAGMDHVENWPESLVLDDLPTLVFPAVALFLSALPAVGINWLARYDMPNLWYLEPATGLILFPFILLSIMETGSVVAPFSTHIFSCLRRRPGMWFWFYVESAAIACLGGWISYKLWYDGGFWRFTLSAIILAATVLIYFRLLGRLGLVCANQAARAAEAEAIVAEKRAAAAEKETEDVIAQLGLDSRDRKR
jgi:hypothetical protein